VFRDLLKRKFVFLDGAMGTMLQAMGADTGEGSEIACLTNEKAVEEIHRMYIQSGSDIIYTNTLCANSFKLKHSGISAADLITKAVRIAKRACEGTGTLAALDIGSIGQIMEPAGELTFDDAYAMFSEQVTAGEKAGADLVVFETMSDLYEVKAAVLAAKENTSLPIMVTMTFEENHRTYTGCDVKAMAITLEGLGVDAIGINCSLGPKEIYPIAKELARFTSLPLVIKPNAGLPDPHTGAFSVDPDKFVREMTVFAELGVQFFGGCCGTNPGYIGKLREKFNLLERSSRNYSPLTSFCSQTKVVSLDGVRIVGENINPTGKKLIREALLNGDLSYIEEQAVLQAESGADILDVNAGVPGIDEPKLMAELVRTLQNATDLPLQIDSSNADAIEAGLRVYCGKAIVNSVNGKTDVLESILPIVKKYGAAVIGLTLDENGIPDKAEGRLAIAEKILKAAQQYGIPKENIIIDCLVLTVSAQQESAAETLKAARLVKERLGLRTLLGISNISFGLPNRDLLNHTFLTLALAQNIDMAIMNPNIPSMVDAVYAHNVIYNKDIGSTAYLERYAGMKPEDILKPGTDLKNSLEHAVINGLKEEAVKATDSLLDEIEETRLIDEVLIPALDKVGALYESGEIFLPQLLKSAGAAGEAFERIKESIRKKGASQASKGKILLATVKGDIHDIGKNIVKILLENYGFTVYDLGKDVPPEDITKTAVQENIGLIGLSALMTTTAENIRLTVDSLRKSGHKCGIMAGGAVLTAEYAKQMGADFYAKDAREAVRIAKEFFGS